MNGEKEYKAKHEEIYFKKEKKEEKRELKKETEREKVRKDM